MSEDEQFDPDKLLDELFDESVYARARTERPFLSAETLQKVSSFQRRTHIDEQGRRVHTFHEKRPLPPRQLRYPIAVVVALIYVAALQVRATWQSVRRFPLWRALVTACMVWLALVQMLLTVIAGTVALVKRGVAWLIGY